MAAVTEEQYRTLVQRLSAEQGMDRQAIEDFLADNDVFIGPSGPIEPLAAPAPPPGPEVAPEAPTEPFDPALGLGRRVAKGVSSAAAGMVRGASLLNPAALTPSGRESSQALVETARAPARALTPEGGEAPALSSPAAFVGALAEAAPSLAVGVGSAVVAGPLAAVPAIFLLESGAEYDTLKAEGAGEARARMGAAMTGAINAALEQIPLGKISRLLRVPPRGVPAALKAIGGQAVREGATESVQEVVSWVDQWVANPEQHSGRELWERVKETGSVGTALGLLSAGGAVSTPGQVTEVPVLPESEVDADLATLQEASLGIATQAAESIETGRPSTDADIDAAVEAQLLASEPTPIGDPVRANPVREQMRRDFVNATVEEKQTLNPENVQADAEVSAEVELRMAEDAPGELKKFMTSRPGSAADVGVGRALLDQAAARAVAFEATPEEMDRARTIAIKYYEDGSEQGRALRYRRDWTMNPVERARSHLRDALLLPGEALKKRLKTNVTPQGRAKAEADYAREMAKAREMILNQGIDLEALLAPNTPITEDAKTDMIRAIDIAGAAKADWLDATLEYWRNSILSAPSTQVVNIVGNTAFAAWELVGPQKVMETAINRIVKDPESSQPGEIMAAVRALNTNTLVGAWQNAARAWTTERPVWSEEIGDGTDVDANMAMKADPIRDLGPSNIAISGKKGRVIRTPQRFLLFADEIAKSLVSEMVIAQLATRKAATDPSVDVATLRADPTPEMVQLAHEEAVRLTFQKKLGKPGQLVLRARRAWRPMAFVVPFVTTVGNIAKISAAKTPGLGLLMAAEKYRRAVRDAGGVKAGKEEFLTYYSKSEQIHVAAENLISHTLAGIFLGLTWDDPVDERGPLITGSLPADPELREQMWRQGGPTGIRVGDRRYNLSRVEPFAFPLIAMADMGAEIQRLRREDAPWQPTFEKMLQTLGSFVRDKPFMRGMSDMFKIFDAMNRGEGIEAIVDWGSNFTTSFVPNIVKATGKATTPYIRDTKVKEKGVAWAIEQGKIIGENAAGGLGGPVRLDPWGEEIKLGTLTGHPATDIPFRIFSPFRTSEIRANEVDRLILNWNNANPSDVFAVREPRRFYTNSQGKSTPMTRDEFHEYFQRSGRMAKQLIMDGFRQRSFDADNPTKAHIKIIQTHFSNARRVVKAQMFGGR